MRLFSNRLHNIDKSIFVLQVQTRMVVGFLSPSATLPPESNAYFARGDARCQICFMAAGRYTPPVACVLQTYSVSKRQKGYLGSQHLARRCCSPSVTCILYLNVPTVTR